ncbi:hypothetical protein [Pontibacter anaerobius]|uniref:Uncharacterized protein n=1 Tax=Pontibacter anaerobius TaxID=2993940 RepID=A0ABT3RGU9_9BACT|nr:hypothetical protein [Pontibacter anaerobius]MCX2740990.1 hypothetical protein [Pontibacter anaerobius]
MEFYIKHIYPWLINLSSFSFSIPLLVGILLINKRSSLIFSLLLLYTSFIGLIEITGQLTVYLGTGNNHWIQHLYTPIEYVLLSMVYYYSFRSRPIRFAILLGIAGISVFSVSSVVWGQDITQMNSMPRMVAGALLIALAVLYFYRTANKPRFTYLDRDPMFILSSGIIFYQAGTAMAFSMFNAALAESYDAARICLSIIVVLNILFRIILMLALKRAP